MRLFYNNTMLKEIDGGSRKRDQACTTPGTHSGQFLVSARLRNCHKKNKGQYRVQNDTP
jgi:hypothetical protein